MVNTHSYYNDDGSVVNVPHKSKHLYFNQDGVATSKPINVKYAWFTEKNRRIVIAYIRNYRNGATLYAASILRTDLPTHHLYSKKSYHRYVATDRLFYYPIYIQTDINVHQSLVEKQIRKSINKYGVCDRNCDYWDEDADYLFNNAKYVDIINPFTNNNNTKVNKIRKEILDILPYDAEYIWFKHKNKKIICVYCVDRTTNEVFYNKCIFKPNNKEPLTKQQKLGHVKTAINRYLKSPKSFYCIASNKKELHYMLKLMVINSKNTKDYSIVETDNEPSSPASNVAVVNDSKGENSLLELQNTYLDDDVMEWDIVSDIKDISSQASNGISSSAECDSPTSVVMVENKPTRSSNRIKKATKHYTP